MLRLLYRALILSGVLSAFALSSHADVVFQLGNNPQSDEQNILFTIDQTGTTIYGTTNITGTLVTFMSTEEITALANGQAVITATDGLINDLMISLSTGSTFLDLIINPLTPTGNPTGPFDLTVNVTTNDGVFSFTYPSGLGNGENFLTMYTTNNELISSVSLTSTSGFDSLKQPRISGVSTAQVPEPAALFLMGGALLGFGRLVRKSKR